MNIALAVLAVACSLLVATPLMSEAEPRRYHIGVLQPTNGRSPLDDSLEQRMSDLGWVSGRTVTFTYKYSRGNAGLSAAARELVRAGVDVIVTAGTPASLAARDATATIPVVFYSVGDPVGVGLVSSLSQPAGNVTGISGITYQLGAKRLELLRGVVPEARLFGVLLNPTDPTASQVLQALKSGLHSGNLIVEAFYARRPAEINAAFLALRRRGVSGVLVQPDGMFWAHRTNIVKLATDLRLPVIYGFREDVDAGGLMSYGANMVAMQARAVAYVDRILRGVSPASLPVEEPTKFDFAINLKTAKQLGLAIPPALLLRADQVVE